MGGCTKAYLASFHVGEREAGNSLSGSEGSIFSSEPYVSLAGAGYADHARHQRGREQSRTIRGTSGLQGGFPQTGT